MRTTLLLFSLLLSLNSWSLSAYQQHILHSAQGFSAFFMYGQSEGDPRYLEEFNLHLQKADKALTSADGQFKKAFEQRWIALQPILKYESRKNMGIFFNALSRLTVREYLTDLYLFHNQMDTKVHTRVERIRDLQLLSALAVSRAIELKSDLFNVRGLSEHDAKLDFVSVFQEMKSSLNKLQAMPHKGEQLSSLRKAQDRLAFINKVLSNDDGDAPYFLMYSSAKTIDKLLRNSL